MRRRFFNFLGWLFSYGNCAECGDSWYWKPWDALTYEANGDTTKGMFPICKDCLHALSVEQVSQRCYVQWLKWGESLADYPAAVLWRSIREAKGEIPLQEMKVAEVDDG